ncbi:helix-turn-helix domain-containing protein [Caulobacter segnis]
MGEPGWAGKVWIGRDWWCFEGVSGDSRFHGHLCAQVVAGLDGPARVEEEAGVVAAPSDRHPAGRAPSAARRRRAAAGDLSAPARTADAALGPGAPGRRGAAPAAWASLLRREDPIAPLNAEAALAEATAIDPRLKRILDELGGELSLAELATRVDLSTARLRALAQAELGAPLAHWRLWARLETALLRLRAGEGLAIAAAEAGFADQSHLNRAMNRFFGITP